MAQVTYTAYMAELSAASGSTTSQVIAIAGGAPVAATIPAPGQARFTNVNTPGRDITLLDFRAERVLRNTGLGSTPLLLRPFAQIANSPTDATLAGLTPAITDTEKFQIGLRKEYDGFFSVNPYQPSNKGPVSNQAAMVAIPGVSKYDYCQRVDLTFAPYIFTGTDPTNAAQWVTEASAGFTSGTPKVVIDWGDNNANDPQYLRSGHAPVRLVYWKSVGNIDYWGS